MSKVNTKAVGRLPLASPLMRKTVLSVVLVILTAACGGEAAEDPVEQPTSTATPTTISDSTTSSTIGATTADSTTSAASETTAPTSTSATETTTDTVAPSSTTNTIVGPTTTSSTTTIPEPVLPPSPLTGLGVENSDLLNRRTMAVKVDNHWDARPQSGIGEAEAVFEILVESGITRFIALFHSVDSPAVGPVRSVRPTDPHLLRPFNATLLTSGGQDWILRSFPRNGVGVIGEIGVGGFRDPTRKAPHNYYVNTAELRSVADDRLYPNTDPPPLFEFGELSPDANLGGVSQVEMEWAPTNAITWRWNGVEWERHLPDGPHTWTRGNGVEEIITADTLVVLFSNLFYTQPPTGNGYALPTMETTGEGRMLVFAKGQVAEGKWERADTTQPFSFLLHDGSPMTVPAGRPWISLFPEGRPVSW